MQRPSLDALLSPNQLRRIIETVMFLKNTLPAPIKNATM
jgi:hypothetical protein